MKLTRLTCIAGPVGEPVTANEAKLHLRVTQAYEDALVDRQIQAAREFVEAFTGRACLSQMWLATYDGFPAADAPIVLPKPPLTYLMQVTFVNANGQDQVWAEDQYVVSGAADVTAGDVVHPQAQAGELWPVAGVSYPATSARRDAVRVSFACGYGPNPQDVPAMLTAAIKIKLADLFSLGRESRAPLTVAYDKNAIENLLGPFVIFDRWPPDVLTEGVA